MAIIRKRILSILIRPLFNGKEMSVCPNKECRSLNTKNLQTRNRSGKPNPINKNKANIPYTKRYRVCLDCGKRYSTREYTIPDLIEFAKLPEIKRVDDLMPS